MAKRTMGKRIYREPTAEQAAKYRRIREMIVAEIPEIKQEAKTLRQGRRVRIQEAVAMLKAERELRGLSLAEISERTGISRSAISRLENNQEANPTINTLAKYADALRMELSVTLDDRP
ncbi:MAG: helix-turn-helix transcriptional regulator [Pirellulaceae bacterium]|nr:helix-turn-helix transcriptional regulator [Pirellulaceae bacterium]